MILNSAFQLPHSKEQINEAVFNLEDTTRDSRVEGILNQYGLNWDVASEQLFRSNGKPVNEFGVIRQDTGHSFGAVKAGYVPFQNWQVVQLGLMFADIAKTEIETITTANNKGFVNVQIKGRQHDAPLINKGSRKVGDKLSSFINISHNQGGLGSLKVSLMHVVLSCTNGMTTTQLGGSISIRHTLSMKKKLEKILKEAPNLVNLSQEMVASYFTLSSKKIEKRHIDHVRLLATGVNYADDKLELAELHGTTAKNVQAFNESLEIELSEKGKNGWGLLSAQTHFTTRKTFAAVEAGKDTMVKSKYEGAMSKTDALAYKYLIKELA